jgi:hypothetical protein
MTQQQLHELIKSHHPDMTETEIRIRLNNASKEFARKSRSLEGAFEFSTEVGKRYYGLDSKIIEVKHVDFDGKTIQRSLVRPEERDLT